MECALKYLDNSPHGKIAYRTWGENRSALGTLFILHGLGEHGGRWEWICRWFAHNGWHCIVPDHFGHGLSAGRRGHIDRFEVWSDATVHLRSQLSEIGKPVFLFGHSLGGLIGMDAALKSQDSWNACVFSAPWLQLALDGRKFEERLARLAARWWPSLSFPTGLRKNQMADELLVSLTPDHKSMIHKLISARAYVEILNAARRMLASAPDFRLPCLLTHGAEDPVMSIAGSKAWLESCGSTEKSLHIFDAEKHEPHHGVQREAVLDVIHKWLVQQS